MTLQEQLIRAVSILPPSEQQKVLSYVSGLHVQPVVTPAPKETLYEKALRLGAVGIMDDAPPDLSTNPKYMAGFGCD